MGSSSSSLRHHRGLAAPRPAPRPRPEAGSGAASAGGGWLRPALSPRAPRPRPRPRPRCGAATTGGASAAGGAAASCAAPRGSGTARPRPRPRPRPRAPRPSPRPAGAAGASASRGITNAGARTSRDAPPPPPASPMARESAAHSSCSRGRALAAADTPRGLSDQQVRDDVKMQASNRLHLGVNSGSRPWRCAADTSLGEQAWVARAGGARPAVHRTTSRSAELSFVARALPSLRRLVRHGERDGPGGDAAPRAAGSCQGARPEGQRKERGPGRAAPAAAARGRWRLHARAAGSCSCCRRAGGGCCADGGG